MLNSSPEEPIDQEGVNCTIQDLWKKYKQEPYDTKSRNVLMEQYLPLVHVIAGKIHNRLPRSIELEDLVSYGVFGLIDAMEKFDLDRGIKFESYCTPRIHGAIMDELRKDDFAPRRIRSLMKKNQEVADLLRSVLGRPPMEEEIAEAMEMNIEDYHKFKRESRHANPMSLETPADAARSSEQHKEVTIQMQTPDKKSPDPTDCKELQREFWFQVLKGLSTKERLFLLLYYREDKFMVEVGHEFGFSEAYISQMHSRIIRDMKIKFQAHTGTGDYLDNIREEQMRRAASPRKSSSKRKYQKRWKVPQQELESAAQEL